MTQHRNPRDDKRYWEKRCHEAEVREDMLDRENDALHARVEELEVALSEARIRLREAAKPVMSLLAMSVN